MPILPRLTSFKSFKQLAQINKAQALSIFLATFIFLLIILACAGLNWFLSPVYLYSKDAKGTESVDLSINRMASFYIPPVHIGNGYSDEMYVDFYDPYHMSEDELYQHLVEQLAYLYFFERGLGIPQEYEGNVVATFSSLSKMCLLLNENDKHKLNPRHLSQLENFSCKYASFSGDSNVQHYYIRDNAILEFESWKAWLRANAKLRFLPSAYDLNFVVHLDKIARVLVLTPVETSSFSYPKKVGVVDYVIDGQEYMITDPFEKRSIQMYRVKDIELYQGQILLLEYHDYYLLISPPNEIFNDYHESVEDKFEYEVSGLVISK